MSAEFRFLKIKDYQDLFLWFQSFLSRKLWYLSVTEAKGKLLMDACKKPIWILKHLMLIYKIKLTCFLQTERSIKFYVSPLVFLIDANLLLFYSSPFSHLHVEFKFFFFNKLCQTHFKYCWFPSPNWKEDTWGFSALLRSFKTL